MTQTKREQQPHSEPGSFDRLTYVDKIIFGLKCVTQNPSNLEIPERIRYRHSLNIPAIERRVFFRKASLCPSEMSNRRL